MTFFCCESFSSFPFSALLVLTSQQQLQEHAESVLVDEDFTWCTLKPYFSHFWTLLIIHYRNKEREMKAAPLLPWAEFFTFFRVFFPASPFSFRWFPSPLFSSSIGKLLQLRSVNRSKTKKVSYCWRTKDFFLRFFRWKALERKVLRWSRSESEKHFPISPHASLMMPSSLLLPLSSLHGRYYYWSFCRIFFLCVIFDNKITFR